MLFYLFLGPALLTASTVFSLVKIETKHVRSQLPPPNFTNDTVVDVIRNISRVNNALQELIKNYEQLQQIYKTESFESGKDYSSDSEVDERYKYEKRKKKNRSKHSRTTEKPADGWPATQLPFEDPEESSVTDDESVEETKKGSVLDDGNHKRLPTIQSLQAQSSPVQNKIQSDSTESSISNEKVEKEKMPMQTTTTRKPPQLLFVDSHKLFNNASKSIQRPQANIEPIRGHEHATSPKQKTRYKKVDHRDELRSGLQNDVSLSINVNSMPKTNSSKYVANSESLPREKMWDEGSGYEPIKTHDDAYFRTKTKKENEGIRIIPGTEKSFHRNGPKAPEPGKQRASNQDSKSKNSENDSESAAEEKELNKEIFKTHVLRQAYGDSCTKLVVRNCFKACKAVLKRSCMGSACKSSFKTAFHNSSKTSCIKQFDASKTQAKTTTKASGRSLRTGGLSFLNDDYLTTACWPLLGTNPPKKARNKKNSTSLKPEEQLLLLRNRYEQACKDSMTTKCNKACMDSYELACKSSECPKKREKLFRRNCKHECREIFRHASKESEEAEESSETSSSSNTSDSTS